MNELKISLSQHQQMRLKTYLLVEKEIPLQSTRLINFTPLLLSSYYHASMIGLVSIPQLHISAPAYRIPQLTIFKKYHMNDQVYQQHPKVKVGSIGGQYKFY